MAGLEVQHHYEYVSDPRRIFQLCGTNAYLLNINKQLTTYFG